MEHGDDPTAPQEQEGRVNEFEAYTQFPENCDCYTDENGYWQLGAKCLEVERQQWARAMRAAPRLVEMLRDMRSNLSEEDVQ